MLQGVVTPPNVTKLVVVLVKPSNYDARGYLRRYLRGVIPSNSHAAIYSLTHEAFRDPELARLEPRVEAFDEICERVDVTSIMNRYRDENALVVVGLVAVQTNQFPRAYDLAVAFQKEGAVAVIGGFHVSGSISILLDGKEGLPCPGTMPRELQDCIDRGIILFHGEAEDPERGWRRVLKDIVRGETKPIYRGGRPNIANAPLPRYPDDYFRHFLIAESLDAGRGCPWKCSFCTIINVQGNDPRNRSVAAIVAHVRAITERRPGVFFFITDDNFARHPEWRNILEGLIDLKRQGLRFTFMVEADLAAWKLPGFVELLAKAGCTEVFMGVESVNQASLIGAKKRQNRVDRYREMCDCYHEHGIFLHAGYIVGFPEDTPESVPNDIETLKAAGFDHASFFILTPLPGSEDHLRAVLQEVVMEKDLNAYDSFQPVTCHPRMTREEWLRAYEDAWRKFYTPAHMANVLTRTPPALYYGILRKFFWYRWSALVEKTHPMIAGLYRFEDFRDRRPGMPFTPLRHAARQVYRHLRYLIYFVREFYVFQGVYFETRWLPRLATALPRFGASFGRQRDAIRLVELKWRHRIEKSTWFGRTFGAAAHRGWLNRFWRRYASERWNLLYKWWLHALAVPHAFAETVYAFRFLAVSIRVAMLR